MELAVKYASREVSTSMKIQVHVFCAVTLCSRVAGYQLFGGSCCLHLKIITAICTRRGVASHPVRNLPWTCPAITRISIFAIKSMLFRFWWPRGLDSPPHTHSLSLSAVVGWNLVRDVDLWPQIFLFPWGRGVDSSSVVCYRLSDALRIKGAIVQPG